jgi:hypothetical protein
MRRRCLPLLALLTACAPLAEPLDADRPDAALPDDVVLADALVIADEDPCVLDAEAQPDRVVLHLAGCDPTTRGFEPGALLAGSHDGGYLRWIESVAFGDRTITAWTSEAALSDAIERGGFAVTIEPEDLERSLVDFSNTVLFDDRVLGSDVWAELRRGSFDVSPRIDLDGHWSEGSVERFDFDSSLSIDADLELLLRSTNGLRLEEDVDLWTFAVPFATAVGPLPVVGEAGFKVKVGVRADAPGQARIVVGASGEGTWGAERTYRRDQGWSERPLDDGAWELTPPEFDLSGQATGRVHLRIEGFVTFYGVAGPELRTDAYAEFDAESACDGIAWDADAGVEATAQVRMNILDKFTPTKVFARADLTADVGGGVIPYPLDRPRPCQQAPIACGGIVVGDTAEGRAQLDGYSCNVGNYGAPEVIYEWVADRSGPVEWALLGATPTEVNHDVVVLEGAFGLATGQCSDWGANSVAFDAVAGRTYFLVVDGYGNDAGAFTAALTCD